MTATCCLLAPSRNASTEIVIRNCFLKLLQKRKTLELKDNRTEEDSELIMNLSPAYVQQCEVWKEEGNLEGQSLMVASLLSERFGVLDEELKSLIPTLMQLPLPERTQLLLNLVNLSREDLLERLSRTLN